MTKITILGRLPGWNELNAGHWARRNRLKQEAKDYAGWYVLQARVKPFTCKVVVEIRCFEPNARRDDDNVTSGASKILLDLLQDQGIIRGDGQKYVRCIKYPVEVDRKNPRIEVTITPMEG